MCRILKIVFLAISAFGNASAFVPSPMRTQPALLSSPDSAANSFAKLRSQGGFVPQNQPSALKRQRQSVAAVQTMSLFGLGGPEIAIILVVAAFVLGPQKLAELGKDAGKIAGDLKEVPKEFQKGFEEGQIEAKASKAKEMESLAREIEPEKDD
uniref:Sec-independent protein translocase protein TatA n=1 Tax=Trieres chinensis TaxID=1514140 RepID=A0A7S1Z7J6_TRICV|mmetsp:Transcript_19394/g.39310  ORF Transcript_19394/g.39310 Transcript_19394/m.39310 type:complete len:154 (+) Transcript_19394:120-581(+)